MLTTEEKQYLRSIGFINNPLMYDNNYYRIVKSTNTIQVLIVLDNNSYKIDIFELDVNGDIVEDYDTLYSNIGENLKQFINE
jgi:hypothetical protein